MTLKATFDLIRSIYVSLIRGVWRIKRAHAFFEDGPALGLIFFILLREPLKAVSPWCVQLFVVVVARIHRLCLDWSHRLIEIHHITHRSIIMMGRSGGSSGRRRRVGGRGCWAPRLSRTQRQNLLAALVISLSLLLCLQVCLFLPILARQDASAADRLLAVSNGGAAPEPVSPWAAFHHLPRVCLQCHSCCRRLQSNLDRSIHPIC